MCYSHTHIHSKTLTMNIDICKTIIIIITIIVVIISMILNHCLVISHNVYRIQSKGIEVHEFICSRN